MNRAVLTVAMVCAAAAATAPATSSEQFVALTYRPRTETTIRCARNLECEVTLEPGERVFAGFAAAIDDWDPHVGYSGPKGGATAHLVFRPARAGLRTNVVVTTSRRSYYLELVSDDSRRARYYGFAFPHVFIARSAPAAPTPAPIATPAPDPMAACLGYRYTYDFDRNLPADHAPGARTNRDALSALWQPWRACTDGRHTFVQFTASDVVPTDLPIVNVLGPDGDSPPNYTYDPALRRFTIDGVPDAIVFELGSQDSPLRLVVRRVSNAGTTLDPGARK
jgi:type IV secretion system protein TrbG